MTWGRLVGSVGLIGAAVVSSGAVRAGTRIYVSMAGRDDTLPKLGRPGISVRVEAPDSAAAAALGREIRRELASLVHTRELAPDEAGDYDLAVMLKPTITSGQEAIVPFEAMLDAANGRRLWRIEGRAEVEGAPVDPSVFDGIGRSVVSTLIHDGWVQPRYDPDDPPPPPPVIRPRTQ
jgi:hypothetical protein